MKATQSNYNLEAIQNLKDISSFTNKGNPVVLTLLDSLKYNFGSRLLVTDSNLVQIKYIVPKYHSVLQMTIILPSAPIDNMELRAY